MRVLYFSIPYPPSKAGGEWATHGLCKRLAARGHDVTVISGIPSRQENGHRWFEPFELDGVKVIPQDPPFDPGREIALHRPDVVFGQFEPSEQVVAAARRAGVPVALFAHGDHEWKVAKWRTFASSVSLWIWNSPALLEEARRTGYQGERHAVFHPPVERQRVLGPADLERRYVTMVNLAAAKGGNVFSSLVWMMPERTFLGIGGGYGDQVRPEHQGAVPNYELRPNGCDVALAYAQTRVLLVCSRSESFSLAGVEAQANGCPVVASDLSTLRYSLGAGALYTRWNDRSGYAEALRVLDDPALWAAMSDAARENAARFDPEKDADAVCEKLRELG